MPATHLHDLPFRLILSILIKVAILEQGFVVCCGVVPPHAVCCGPRKIAEFHRFHMRRILTAGLCFGLRADINNRQLWTRRRRKLLDRLDGRGEFSVEACAGDGAVPRVVHAWPLPRATHVPPARARSRAARQHEGGCLFQFLLRNSSRVTKLDAFSLSLRLSLHVRSFVQDHYLRMPTFFV
jgi:hypothetical protein